MDLSKAKESLKNYSRGVRSAGEFLQRTESVLLPSLCSPRSCSERLKDVQHALLTSHKEFQSHLAEIQTLAPFSPLFSVQKVEELQVKILGCLLVRMSTLKAQAQLRLEALERYVVIETVLFFFLSSISSLYSYCNCSRLPKVCKQPEKHPCALRRAVPTCPGLGNNPGGVRL